MKTRKFSLVKYDWDSFNKAFKKNNSNPHENKVFCYIGDIPNMPGHSFVIDIRTGTPYIFHPENLKELTDDET